MNASQAETECRAFAAEFPTAQVKRAIWLCETGRLTWAQVYGVFQTSLAKGLAEVK